MDILSYFTAQSSLTDPGEYGALYADLPKSVEGLCQAIQGLFFYYKERYKYPIVNERLLCSHARSASGVLQWVLSWNKAPLTQERGNDDRFLASISDYANLFCSMARAQGTPARKRVGFVEGESFELAEYWDGSAWKQIDPSGLAKGAFVPAAEAWQACRSGKTDPNVYHDEQHKGLEVVRNNLLLDLAAMNKVELLNWDRYGWLLRPLDDFSDRAWETMDKIAALLLKGDQALEELQALYAAEEGVQVPRVIHCDSPVVPPHKAELSL
jgi:hypothetical protein